MHFAVVTSLFVFLLVVSITAKRRVSAPTSNYRDEALAETNTRRAAHCASPLRFDSELNDISQKRADRMCRTNSFAQSQSRSQFRGQSLGENLYTFSSSEPIDLDSRSGSEAISTWYKGKKSYDFESPGFSSQTGSFTQLVWTSSKLLGFGYCCTEDQLACYVVANYFPAGNVLGQFEDNVQSTSC